MAVSDHGTFNASGKDAWRYITLREHVPNGQATHLLQYTFA